MTSVWTCTVPGRPTTKGNSGRVLRTSAGRPFIARSAQATRAEADARSVIAAHAPNAPLEGALVCDVTFVFSVPQAQRKARRPTIVAGMPCLRRVDRGNLLKLIEDAMNGLVYIDDHQIVAGDVRKVWGERDETRITVTVLGSGAEAMPGAA